MDRTCKTLAALAGLALIAGPAQAVVTTTVESDGGGDREFTGTFVFDTIPSNASDDLADVTNGNAFVLLAGTQNGDRLANLNNGVAQTDRDVPAESFFAQDGSDIRIMVDLGETFALTEINTFSWHRGSRTAQNYRVYGADDPGNTAPDFGAAAFQDDTALEELGFSFIATVSTGGGDAQVGVSHAGDIGTYRYVVFDIDQASNQFGTFYGEIDIYGDPATPGLPGDTDNDGDIDDADLANAFSNFTGPVPDSGKTAAQGDTDGDGDVDDADLANMFAAFTGPLGPAGVPEPASLVLLGAGALCSARRRRTN